MWTIRLLDKTKLSLFSYFYVFCILIYAGNATVFARDLGDIRTVGNAFALLLTVGFYYVRKIPFSRNYVVSLLVFLLYAAVTSLKNHMVNPFWISQWLIWLTIAYGLCRGFGRRLFVVVETVVCHLSIIALCFWVVYLVSPGLMARIVLIFEFSRAYAEDSNVIANMIFFTLPNVEQGLGEFQLFPRNPGFAWEPGAFASMVCLGIFCNILRTNFRLRQNPPLWVFFLALISSESTTGIMTLLLMLIVWLFANRKYGWGFVVLPLAITLFSLPFVSSKMFVEYESLETLDLNDAGGALNRTYSLMLDWQEFLRHPIIGLGGWAEGTYLARVGYEVTTISGIGEMLVRFGAIMTLLFLWLLVHSARTIRQLFSTTSAYILIVTVLGMMYSYNLWTAPLYIAFWMFGFYYPIKEKKQMLARKYRLIPRRMRRRTNAVRVGLRK